MSKSTIARRLLATTILAGGAFATAVPAMAQDDDEIVITGTRIKRTDLEAPSPVTSIGSEALQLTNTVNTEQFLNSLPQAVPGFDSSSNNPGDGTATVDLRGLGARRTLVLVDGHRYVSSDPGGVVDLNSIPSAMVERVDIVTGGASAVYGSDAMAGVVNFILRDDFEGLELSSSYELTESNDGGIFDVNAVAGGSFADDLGNAVLSIGYTKRDEVFQGDRDFSRVANDDNGTGFDPFGSSGVPGSRFFQTHNFTALGLGTLNVGTLDTATGSFSGSSCGVEGLSLRDPDGSLTFEDVDLSDDFSAGDTNGFVSGDEFCGANATFNAAGDPIPWINSGPNTTRYNYAPVNYLQLPQERFNVASFVNYDLTEDTTFKMRGIYTSNSVPQELAPTPFFSSVTVSTSNPNLTASSQAAIVGAIAYNQEVADQAIVDATEVNARAIALETATPGTYTAAELAAFSAAIGTATTARAGISNTDLPVFIGRRMLEVGPRNAGGESAAIQLAAGLEGSWLGGLDWDVYGHFNRTSGSFIQTGNVSISAMQAAVTDGTCDIFGPNHLSDACVSAVARTGAIAAVIEQTDLIATTRGSLFDWQLPSAENPAAFAVGLEYREEFADFKPDSVLGPDVAGFNQSLPIKGRYSASEVFGELWVPVIEGAQLAEELSLNGAFRYSDYSTIGGVESYSYGVEWAPVAGLRFRAQQQRAVRAPNIGELFSPATNGFPGAIDPCSSTSTAAATGNAAICAAQGVPGALYNTEFQANSQLEGLFGGNPNLDAETSDTLTVGFVAQPSFAPGLVVTLDYWNIEIEDAIGTIPIQTVLDGCYDGSNPSYCALVNRTGAGLIDFVELNNQNVAFLGGEGVDLQLDYTMDVGEGTLRGNLIGGYKLADEFQALPGDPVDDCVGYFGGNAGVCGEPSPEWKHTARLDYIQGPLLVSGRWRYIGESIVDDFQTTATPGLFADSIDAYNYFDITGQYEISDNVQISGGIQNIADETPPELGDCCSEQANTWPATYDALGRTFFVGGKLTF